MDLSSATPSETSSWPPPAALSTALTHQIASVNLVFPVLGALITRCVLEISRVVALFCLVLTLFLCIG